MCVIFENKCYVDCITTLIHQTAPKKCKKMRVFVIIRFSTGTDWNIQKKNKHSVEQIHPERLSSHVRCHMFSSVTEGLIKQATQGN
jgi:hypothetical protein